MMLFEKLKNNAESDMLPMHMPGHKRNTEQLGRVLPYELDITEISGFDDLHNMSGVLRDLSASAASLYGAAQAFPMINGTTGGVLAAVRAALLSGEGCVKPGGSIIMSRFSHRSVYNAAELCGLTPVYLLPEKRCGITAAIRTADVLGALEDTPDVRCVVVTSPSYEGAVSDIAAISELTHMHLVPLIVDAAHGAHFGISRNFPKNAVRLGADIELMSLHKTLPALTQSSLALVSEASLISHGELGRQLRVFETSSPSYVLLASIEKCVELLRDCDGIFSKYEANLRYFMRECNVWSI